MRLGDTPVLIPNTMVKTQAADGTILETVWESRWLPDPYGGIAQLGEHLPCKQGVKGSNPFISTIAMSNAYSGRQARRKLACVRACDVIKPEIIERLLNQLLLKQRTQKPVINAMMAADQEYRSSIKSAGWMPWH